MTKITYEWLNEYQKLEDDIAYLEDNLRRTKRELNRYVSGDLMDVKLTSDSQGAKLEENVERIEWNLAHKMNDIYDLTKLIFTFRGLEHQILRLKYVDGLSLEQVAEELNYSISHIKKRHADAMRSIRFAIEYSRKKSSV